MLNALSRSRAFAAAISLVASVAVSADNLALDESLMAKTSTNKPAAAPPRPVLTKAPRYVSKPVAKKDDKKKDEAKKPERFDDEKPFDEIVKNMEVIKGLFTFYRKADDNKIYLEITTNQFDKQFLFSASVDSSVGEKGLYASQMAGDFPFEFHLVGKNVQMLIKNSLYTATNGTPAQRATAKSFAPSLLASAKILSRPHPERKSLLVNASDLFVADLPGFARALKQIYTPTDYRFDKANSSISNVKSFPDNALLEVWLHFASDNPRANTLTLPDARSLPIVMKYDFMELKATGYKPRLADDRVGHFLSVQADYTSDHPKSIMIRRVNRWNLEKTDPKADLSAPKKPIVFWLENTIPIEYRAAMTEGVLLWNKAFEKIGFKDAIVVKQMPDNADWDPADSRYNTIRWFIGVDASFAIGPSRANPYTGEIYDADIGFAEGIIRSIRRHGEEFIGPVVSPTAPITAEEIAAPKLAWSRNDHHTCSYASGLAHQAAFGVNVLQARGALSKEMEEKLMREFLIQVTAHEVGHTLGFRHNFRASNMLKPEELLDDAKTEKVSQSGSVMDYNPIVIAGKGQKQGHFVPVTLGPYDYLAVEYAYKPIEGDEAVELAKIASKAAQPELGYSTDEDAMGTFSPAAMDPMVNQFDQSSDPIGFFSARIDIIRELWKGMESNLLEQGQGYQVLRRAMNRSMNEYLRGILIGSKFIGGVYHYRDHFGDPNGRTPYEPVPADRQRESLAFLQKNAFSESAFELPPTLLNRLAIERLPGISGLDGLHSPDGRADYPWHEVVLSLQRSVLARMYQPVTLGRLQDNEIRFRANEKIFTMADMFAGMDESIWSEIDRGAGKISAMRRNLQREQLKHLSRLTVRNIGGVPEDATSLARASLNALNAKIDGALKANRVTDATSRAHLQECSERIKAALDAKIFRTTE